MVCKAARWICPAFVASSRPFEYVRGNIERDFYLENPIVWARDSQKNNRDRDGASGGDLTLDLYRQYCCSIP